MCFECGCFEWDLVLDLKKLLNSTSYIINAHDLYFWGVLPPSPFTPQFQCPWIPFPSFAWVGRDTPVISSRINYYWWNTQQHFWYLTTRIFSLDLQQIIRQCSNVSTGVQFVISNSDFAPNLLQQYLSVFWPRPSQKTKPQVCFYFLLSNTHYMFRLCALITWYLINYWQKS